MRYGYGVSGCGYGYGVGGGYGYGAAGYGGVCWMEPAKAAAAPEAEAPEKAPELELEVAAEPAMGRLEKLAKMAAACGWKGGA